MTALAINEAPRKSFDADGVQFAWDATSLDAWLRCPRYYQYTILEGWTGLTLNPHLWFGGHIADALEKFYKLLATGNSWDEAVREITRSLLISTWDSEAGVPIDAGHNAKTRDNLIRTFIWYTEHFRDEEIEVYHLENGKPAVELSFSLELSDDILWCGHIDRLVTWGGDIYVMDQKTTGTNLVPRFWKQFHLSNQMSGYTFAGRTIYNIPVKGVIIDAMQIAVGFTEYGRQFTFRTDSQLQEWHDEVLSHIANARWHQSHDEYPRNLTACDKYGGCAFREVCARSPERRHTDLQSNFRQQPAWDPLERR